MMLQRLWSTVQTARPLVAHQLRRNIGVSAPLSQKANVDPIQQIFLDKIREYAQKSKASGGKLVDSTPEAEKALKDQIEKLDTAFQAKGQDMTKFPQFSFQEPSLDPARMDVTVKDEFIEIPGTEVEESDSNAAYFDMP